ncbi:MAG: hypothetical protein UY06_C0041G0009 [Candidatus Amesbacteria bacterium GW2011_GWA2_47_70]|nr:MAG: hypothetical protein UY06_C0041G0009 [Candidatus Amesbacteria bacterium GW2011_GWA2_47_70]
MLVGHFFVQAVGNAVAGFEVQAELVQVFDFVFTDETQSLGPLVHGGIVAITGTTDVII